METSAPRTGARGPLLILNLADVDSNGVQGWLVRDVRFEFAFNLRHACSLAGFRLYGLAVIGLRERRPE
jgi:hypothetical protein